MHKSLLRATPRIVRGLRAAERARSDLRRAEREAADDIVGTAIFEEEDDEYSLMFDREVGYLRLRNSPLCRDFGFSPSDLTGMDGAPLGNDHLAVLSASCRAARELGRAEACRVMGVKDKGQSLPSIGIKALFRAAPALQAALNARNVAEVAERVAQAARIPRGLKIPSRVQAPEPQPRPAPSAPRIAIPTRSSPPRPTTPWSNKGPTVAPPCGVKRPGKTQRDRDRRADSTMGVGEK